MRVDLIGGGVLPLYRVSAIRTVGAPDPQFFFSFEDAEYGLRLTTAGYRLYAPGDSWMERRRALGAAGLAPGSLRTAANAAAWRRYYSARNLMVLARRYGTWPAVARTAARAGLGGTVRVAQSGGTASEIALPMRGVFDGLRGRMGRTVDPGGAGKVVERSIRQGKGGSQSQ